MPALLTSLLGGVEGFDPVARHTELPPLILSFSPWEKGRLNDAASAQQRSLSHGERDRVRGDSLAGRERSR